jgi:phosphohistidine phosphatase SixA
VTRAREVLALVVVLAAALSLASGPASAQAPKPETSCFSVGGIAPTDSGSAVNASLLDSTRAAGSVPPDSSKGAASESTLVIHYHPPDSTLMAALKRGGYIIVFRHGKTDWAQRDADLVNFGERATQRNLSEQGRKEAIETGKAIAGLHIPIGTVLSSPMWRCRDTAELAFGHADTTSDWFQKGAQRRDARLRWLSTPPAPGKNLAIVTHQDVLLPITKLRRDELGEGEALIVKPLGKGAFEVLAQVSSADWIRFLPSRKP